MTTVQESFELAVREHRAGALGNAERLYREILQIEPSHADALHLLGVVAHQQDQPAEAVRHIERAIVLRPHSAIFHYNLAAAHRALGEVNLAIQEYLLAVEAKPDYVDAWRSLGSLMLERGDLHEAGRCYCRLVELQPNDADGWFRLGNIATELDQPADAQSFFQCAVEIQPKHAEAHFNLGNALRAAGEPHSAIRHYRRAIEVVPDFSRAHFNLAATYYELGQQHESQGASQQAAVCFQHALRARPEHAAALVSLGNVLKGQDDVDDARACYRTLLHHNQPAMKLWIESLCPAVFADAGAIDEYRQNLLHRLQQMIDGNVRLGAEEISSLGSPVPYNLQFHGRDDLPLKQAFANLIAKSISPQPQASPNEGPPRVGFVVTTGHEGAFLRYLREVIVRLRGSRFERVIVCAQQSLAYLQSTIADDSVQFVAAPDRLEDAIEVIRRAQLDVLYHWEVGSDVLNYFLPFYRLAPVQCTSAGLPVTSGIPAMDYFLSTDLAEPDDAARHYSERLIRAGSQLTFQQRMVLPAKPKPRPEFGLSSDEHLYVCAQKIEKFHPEFDGLMAEILRRDERGRIVIPRDKGGFRSRKLQRRIATSFPDVIDRVTFLPRLELDDYLSLLHIADVVLDPIHYGGGLTAWDAFSLNKPVVTLPTSFVRGRYCHGFYRQMGIDDCTAVSLEDYVRIAVTLGTDEERRRTVVERITDASPVLFEEQASVRDYETIFDRLIDEARSGGRRSCGAANIAART